jgi:alkanesulfonate monooxygenase SsuD/methylene tetrahydromethanopterin reductase-like flavin-dependent oxidoreductase (luciferase family)
MSSSPRRPASTSIRRYHPAVVAQKAATMQLLSDGRFTLGLGAGENLNEHIVGGRWPVAGVRHQMLQEAVEIIRACGRAAQ